MQKICWGIYILFGWLNCSDKNPVGEYPIIDVVGSAGKYQKVYYSDYFSSIELIPLETRNECVVVDFYLLNDSVILMGGDGRLYAFDRSGKFRNQIGERGQGPGEYQISNNIFFNTDKPTIFISDLRNMLEYDYNGKCINYFKKPTIGGVSLNRCSYAGDSLFIGQVYYDGKNRYKYCIFDHEDTIKCFPNHIFYNKVGTSVSTFDAVLNPVRIDDRLFLKDYINDTIYTLDDSNLQPAYVFGFGKYALPLEHQETNDLNSKIHLMGKSLYCNNMVGMPNCFFYSIYVPDVFSRPPSKPRYNPLVNEFRSTEGSVFGLYDIERNINTLLDTDSYLQKGMVNDMNGGLSFVPRFYAGNNTVAGVWEPYVMKEMLTEEYFAKQTIKDPQAHQLLKELLKTLDSEDNPVIVIGTLK